MNPKLPDHPTGAVCDAPAPGVAELQRLAALMRYDIIDTPPEERFDRITRLAQKIFRTSMVTISLLDARRQWFKSRIGVAVEETPREPAFCNVTIQRAEPLVVEDAAKDPMFANNAFVTGEPYLRFYAGAPLITPEGHALGAFCVLDRTPRRFNPQEREILVDLAELVVAEMNLRQIANVDALTGALSRRAFREEAERAMGLAARHGHPLSVLTFDLDRFKSVNDTHGHAVGDAVLQRSVSASMRRLRRSDAVGRLGGEEFAVLLPHVDEPAALKVANALRRSIAAETFETETTTFGVTASFGLATFRTGMDLDDMLKAADGALYLAKAMGRDRCVVAEASRLQKRGKAA
ncbi:sensor domain-containing diguanylate cyclase [Chenggangzhangella methanolivorans]|uniref:diguanylate cyclase n=1 Tax=Chenggangzhangella methanolivorans TaxID=1437009 RepID=A0A9E6R5X3_9HYPH|nr:sensor domain-containing diguanylate cyclase [Chenggangzhangella methanolivorans]QZN98792.1 sensor domain-containing diguanylate cyclase [Chenggangzhangella methanolivorans]